MNAPHRRKKSPERVRALLIENAALLALEKSWTTISLDAIASAAGVTKGGLFHHFANKEALFSAVFDYLIAAFEQAIDEKMQADPEPYGRFTRAYVELAFFEHDSDILWDGLWSAADGTSLSAVWSRWFVEQVEKHKATDGDLTHEAVRFAADGIWAGRCVNIRPHNPEALRDHLIAMTRPR